MPEDLDLAKGIAENIGYMPVINKIGQMGSGFMDFIGSLLGGGGGERTPPIVPPSIVASKPKPNVPAGFDPKTGAIWEAPHYDPNRTPVGGDGGFMDLLSAILDPVRMGLRSTADAFQSDVQDVSQGKLPRAATKDLSTGLAMSGGGVGGPTWPVLPAYKTFENVFDPVKGWTKENIVKYPGSDPLISLFQGNILGSDISDFFKAALQASKIK